MKFLKRSLIAVLVLGLLLGGVVVYLKQFSSSPQATVERFFDCYGNSDINGMVACMEPQAEQMVAGLDTPIQVEVVFYGSDGWRIPMDSDLFS